jgi:hypothetical protein
MNLPTAKSQPFSSSNFGLDTPRKKAVSTPMSKLDGDHGTVYSLSRSGSGDTFCCALLVASARFFRSLETRNANRTAANSLAHG